MENYESINSLIEEVRDILSLHEAPKHDKKTMGKFKKGTKHNPFKRLKKGKRLGPAVNGSDQVPGQKRGRFRCRCRSYKCLCKDAERGGKIKRVNIKKGYKDTYNHQYRVWRKKHAAKFAPGKGTKWKKVKKGTEHK